MTPARIESLHMIERACWRELSAAAHDRLHGWRVLTLATVADGRPEARSVVVRDIDEDRHELIFYCDDRSPKVRQLHACADAVLVGWCARLGWQVRLRAQVTVETAGLNVSSRWAQVKLSRAAQDYLAALPPGTPVDRYQPERGSRDHFAVVTARVHEIDWLELHPDGHRRARLQEAQSAWLTP
jgi:pyridoxamine 5'-phosphate oxidase